MANDDPAFEETSPAVRSAQKAGASDHHVSNQMLEYKGFLIVGGRHCDTRVATFNVLRPERDSDAVTFVYEGIAEGHFATDQAAFKAGEAAGRDYVDSLPLVVRLMTSGITLL